MATFLHALSLKNYRGIGSQEQKIGPFKKCNFFIGVNNSGKSCVLNFISKHLENISQRESSLRLDPLEIHLGATNGQVTVGLGLPSKKIFEHGSSIITSMNANISGAVFEILNSLIKMLEQDGTIYLLQNANNLENASFEKFDEKKFSSIISEGNWMLLWTALTGQSRGSLPAWISGVIFELQKPYKKKLPSVFMVPAIRQISTKEGNFDDYSGKGLINKLANLQNPGPTERELNEKFLAINKFLQNVTGNTTAMIEIPHDRSEVLVHINNRVLPLSSLGTGIHEVVMIAAFCTLASSSIVCIEEPEIHLHPILQKKLIKYINEQTDNQYFIATHSASIIDYAGAQVFHVSNFAEQTSIELAGHSSHKFRICQDLGYKSSDLLQSNAIIWVEGPSDRLYLRHWISTVDPLLREGIHYSIMFYGGRLLSHLSSSDDEISEFINLRSLNRNVAIIIDSDKKATNAEINKTKQRVVEEFESNSEIAWVTAGKEIENYIDSDLLAQCIKATYPNMVPMQRTNRYSNALRFNNSGDIDELAKNPDKVKIAREVCKHPANLQVMDLGQQIQRIVEMIQQANS